MEIITIQPSAHTDHITEDGTELQQLPYPFHVDKWGNVQRQDFWQGKVTRIIGFTARPEPSLIVAYWSEVWQSPELAVGKYVVTSDSEGNWASHVVAIQSATRHDG